MNVRKWTVFGAAMLMLGIALGAARAETTAPDFSLKDTAGRTVTLSALRGKVVFVDFWASWCPPCRASIPRVQQLHEKFKAANVVVLGINVENDAKTAAGFARREGLTYTVLTGSDRVERDYRVSGIPAFFIIDPNGNIVQKFEGYFPGMEKEWERLITKALNGQKKPAAKVR